MSNVSPTVDPATRPEGVWRLVFGMLLTPSAVALAAYTAPRVQVGASLGDMLAFAGATLFPIIGLSLSAMVAVPLAFAFGVGVIAVTALLAMAFLQPSPLASVLLVDTALVCFSWALGCSLGRRVQHAAHLLPACVVAASADIVSLLSPEGPSHAIAASDQALSVVAVWFPVPGSSALAPALGVGDLVFMALALGVARAHGLPYARCIAACAVGTALAGVAAAWSGIAVPALLPIAAVLMLSLPAIRQLRPSDRKAAQWSMLIAGGVALATVFRALLSRT